MINVLIPAAGEGSRFRQVGFSFPKPLIEVNGVPMLQAVSENIKSIFPGELLRFIYVIRKSHDEEYNMTDFLKTIEPTCEVVITDGLTEGAACTTLLAKDLINNSDHLVIANSDQLVKCSPYPSLRKFDGFLLTFPATHPKWSYARISPDDILQEVAEKKVISNKATCGIYFWNKGEDYVSAAEQMIEKDIRTNGEFYVCPAYNEAIAQGKQFSVCEVTEMHGLGTPEDFNRYIAHTASQK